MIARLVKDFRRDLPYAVRILRKSPGFAAAAVASLALGIGANTAIFSLVDAVMLRSLPVREPARLIELLTDRGGQPFNAFSQPALQYFHEHAKTIDGIVASHNWRFHVATDGPATQLRAGQYVTGNYFT
jgi:putative ABC transport system permease protein